ncbi:MAG: hypothetical protein ACRECV_04225 [Xanthobacteraceae bacterium]
MSDRARFFLNDWLGKYIGPLPAVERVAASVRLAGQCRVDAVTAGVPLQEIRDAVGGDLIRKILELLDMAADLQDAVTLQEEVSLIGKSPALAEG